MIRLMIVEDDRDIRDGLRLIAERTKGVAFAGAYGDAESAIAEVTKARPDVILLDIELPGMTGIKAIPELKTKYEKANILMLTVHQDDQAVFDSLCAGASGYLIKTAHPDKIMEAVREIHSGGVPMTASIARMVIQSFQRQNNPDLTPKESEILKLLCQGHSYKMIADSMFVSWETVHSHIKNIYKKLNVNSKSEAVIKALKQKMV